MRGVLSELSSGRDCDRQHPAIFPSLGVRSTRTFFSTRATARSVGLLRAALAEPSPTSSAGGNRSPSSDSWGSRPKRKGQPSRSPRIRRADARVYFTPPAARFFVATSLGLGTDLTVNLLTKFGHAKNA